MGFRVVWGLGVFGIMIRVNKFLGPRVGPRSILFSGGVVATAEGPWPLHPKRLNA